MRHSSVRVGLALCSIVPFVACPGITDPGGVAGGKVEYVGYRAVSCAASASPLPGFRTCSLIVAVTITQALSSGTVSVYFNYPNEGSFYQGELTGLSGFTGTKEVTLKNGYVSSCPKVQTLVDIYDGPRTSQTGTRLLLSVSALVGPLC